ncbi:MAG: right-handed parallel beta-helix repeat-containing protein [Xanthomonadales bacterium]|nr:right-handed parallel beta-helix repeat-containing protein [Xanthomonadales bacterium]MBK7143679.1 right-handed parallel beta-helix repeat-containing protein [Xanthomonadales bacterium]
MLRCCLLLFVLGLASPGRAFAQTITTCADSWAEIVAAISAAGANAGEHDVRIVQGTYVMSGSLLADLHPDAFLSLRGGYNPGCATRTLDPTNTTLAGQSVHMMRIIHNRDLTLEGLTVRHLGGYLQGQAGGLNINCDATDSNIRFVTLRHNIFSDLDGEHAGVYVWGEPACRLDFRNNLVHSITAPAGASSTFSGVALCSGIFDSPRQGEYVDQNTFVGIVAGSGNNAGALAVCKTGTVAHNLFRSNTPRDLDLVAGNAMNVIGNLYDQMPSDGIGGQNVGNFSADPLFVNPGAGDYRLQLASPAINQGATLTDLTQDLAGNGRQVGSRTDLGAYESNLNDLTQVLVTNSADSGAGSLRQALLDANANPNHTLVRFSMPGVCGSQGILLSSALPDISTAVTIDGYTQSGAQPNTSPSAFNAQVCVGLTQIGGSPIGLRAVDGGSLVVRGLWFGNFTGSGAAAIRIAGGSEHVIEGNQFSGALPNGTSVGQNRVNVLLSGGNDTLIGGSTIGQRNLISNAEFQGVAVSGAGLGAGIVVQNNLIGTNAARTATAGNGGAGVSVSTSGGVEILGNVINGNDGGGVSITGGSLGVVIRDNEIGRALQGNAGHGVYVGGGSFSVIVGGSSEGVDAGGNWISYNSGAGVRVADGDAVRVRGNVLWNNMQLGIDLGTAGVTANDAGDGDTGANDLQNFPVLGAASVLGGNLTVSGSLDSGANANYYIDVYANSSCDASGHGQGYRYLGRIDVSTAANGQASFQQSFADDEILPGQFITATATRTGPTNIGDSSEFSSCLAVEAGIDDLFSDSFE